MAVYNGRDKYEDYTYDDEMNDEYYDEYDESEISLTKSISDWFNRTKSSVFKKHDDEDIYDDEELYDDEEDYREEKKSSFKSFFAKNTDADEDFDDEYEPTPQKVKKTTAEYTREDYDSYDKKYGTRGSYARAEQSEKNKAKIFMGKKPKSRVTAANNVTKLYEEERYKGNVKGVLKFSPKGIDDTNDIADNLMNQYAALIDLRGMSKAEILRVLDFIDGVAYVLDYSFDEISKEIYMCAPKGFLKSYSGSRYKNVSND